MRPGGKPLLKLDAELRRLIAQALREDVGSGDVTTGRIVPAGMRGRGKLIAKAEGILCGGPVFERAFKSASPRISVLWKAKEGSRVRPGRTVATIEGPYRALLEGERVALNFIQRLSGIATLTRQMVDAAGGRRGPAICDTRKTTPLWRKLERYAVAVGGGLNHRFGLSDMVLIKENHARAAGSLGEAIRRAQSGGRRVGKSPAQGLRKRRNVPIAAETRDAAEVAEALAEGVDLILLDNMTPGQVRRIVKEFRHVADCPFEVSGGVNLRNIGAYAKTGVDRISIGSLTHSAPALDLSLQLFQMDR